MCLLPATQTAGLGTYDHVHITSVSCVSHVPVRSYHVCKRAWLTCSVYLFMQLHKIQGRTQARSLVHCPQLQKEEAHGIRKVAGRGVPSVAVNVVLDLKWEGNCSIYFCNCCCCCCCCCVFSNIFKFWCNTMVLTVIKQVDQWSFLNNFITWMMGKSM